MTPTKIDMTDIIDADDRERMDRIAKAYNAYMGASPDTLKRRKGEIDDNVKLNYARLIVDAGVAHLAGGETSLVAPDTASPGVQEFVDETIRTNGGGLFLQRSAVSGAIGGTLYWRIQPREGKTPRLVVLDPATVDLEWAPDDHETVTQYTVTWNTSDDDGMSCVRRQLVYPDATGWLIVDQELVEDSGVWKTLNEEAWPYDFPPIVHAQNLPSPHEVYGIGDLEPDVLHLCTSIDRAASTINRILRLYGFPRTYGKMIGDNLLVDANPGSILRLEHPSAELKNLEMQSDLSASIDYYRGLISSLHSVTRIPEVATGKLDGSGQLSALALKIMYAPLLQKTESKRRTYGAALVEAMRRCLEIAGYADVICTIAWPDILPVDPEAQRRTALVDRQLGVSQATLLEQLGYDPEVEDALRSEENAINAEQQQAGFAAGQTVAPPLPAVVTAP
jgi:Phage portal protein, SPP1 Gp6-like